MAATTRLLAVPPYQWQGEHKAAPAELIATSDGLPKTYSPSRWHTWQIFSLHWLNVRLNTEQARCTAGKLQAFSCFALTKSEIQQPDRSTQCRFTHAVAGGRPEECYFEKREDGWWKPCNVPRETIAPEYFSEPESIFVYWLNNKGNYECKVVEGDEPLAGKAEKDRIEVTDVTLRTTREAFDLFSGIWTGRHDMLPMGRPNLATYSLWNHWASIMWTQRIEEGQPEHIHLLPQKWRIVVETDLDHQYEGDLAVNFNHEKNSKPGQFVVHKRKKKDTPSATVQGQVIRYELFVRFLGEGDEVKIFLYKFDSDEWFEVFLDEKIPLLNHVQKQLQLKDGITKGHEWVRVQPTFTTSSKSGIFMFAKADRDDTIIDRFVLKTVQRDFENLKNESSGRSIVPVEYAMNQRIHKMRPSSKELFAKPRHFSYHPSSDKPYYLYLEYADGGSLSHLQKTFIANASERNGPAYLPEIFIWVVFERLLRACYRLHYDRYMRCNDAPRGFITYDLKPANVFLKCQQEANYQNLTTAIYRRTAKDRRKEGRAPPADSGSESEDYDAEADFQREMEIARAGTQYPTRAYPIPILGDLELSLRLGKDRHWDTIGTDGFKAPEQTVAHAEAGTDPAKTDVFQVGCVIYSLMRNSTGGLNLSNGDDLVLVDDAIARTDANCRYDDMYSAGLETLMRACLMQEPEHRPTIKQILREVQDVMSQFSGDHGPLEEKAANEVHRWSQVPMQDDPFAHDKKIGKRRIGLHHLNEEDEDEDEDEEMEEVEEEDEGFEIDVDEDGLARPLSPTPDLTWSGSTSSMESEVSPSSLYRLTVPRVYERGMYLVDNIKNALDVGIFEALSQHKRKTHDGTGSRAARKKWELQS